MSRTITFYKTSDGKCPTQDFLDSLPGKAAQKVTWVLKLIEDFDIVPSSYLKKLTGTEEIWECRIKFGSNAYKNILFLYRKFRGRIDPWIYKKESKDAKDRNRKGRSL